MLNQPQESVSTTTTVSENTVFVEHEVASQRISVLTTSNHSIAEMDSALVDLRGIFDKYLEMPSLLDKHVETMVNKLATAARELMDDTKILTRQHFWSSSLPRHLSALYALSKVRGRKRIRKLLPHRVEDVHAILRTLQGLHEMSRNEGETSLGESTVEGLPQLWESIYVLWNWMAILSLVPFKVTVVIDIEAIDELVDLAKHYLSEAGPTREMASGCLASWISRPDLETTHLEAFQGWSDQVLKEYLHDSRDIILTMGILQTLVTIIKTSTSDRDSLLRLVTPLGPTMMLITATKPNNLLLRKYLIKWWSRVATLYMPPRVTAWRYQRGSRSLKDNVLRTTKSLNNTGETMKKSTFNHHKAPEEYELFLVPDQVEDALGEIISGLTDSSTIVRWSAAKGVGRVTERLPAICSDDVLDAILELFGDREKDNDWHGACLAMAELARRGLLLPHRLHEVVPRIVEAVHVRVDLIKMRIALSHPYNMTFCCSTMSRGDRRVLGRMFETLPVIPIGQSLERTLLKF